MSDVKNEINAILTKGPKAQLTYDERAKVLMYFMGTLEGIINHTEDVSYAAPHGVERHMDEALVKLEEAFMRLDQAFRINLREKEEEESEGE